jgi:protein involved in polysaccharide export with SLBB domain
MKARAMKVSKMVAFGAWLPLASVLAGCGSVQYADPVNPPQPFTFPGQTPAAVVSMPAQAPGVGMPSPALPQSPVPIAPVAVNPNQLPPHISSGVLRVGDLVRVSLLDIPQPPQPVEIRIPDDGRITLPYNITVDARGKSVSQLQEEIRNAYVPTLFVRLTVNIKTEERFYFVGGEVRVPNRQPYMGEMTVLRAIDTAGGFTDFASRKKIELRRANGEIHNINWDKARKNPKLDLIVYPNDQITVGRRW